MNALVVADRVSEWRRLKALVLDSVSSPVTRRVYNLGLDEFIAWFTLEPRPAGLNDRDLAVTLASFPFGEAGRFLCPQRATVRVGDTFQYRNVLLKCLTCIPARKAQMRRMTV